MCHPCLTLKRTESKKVKRHTAIIEIKPQLTCPGQHPDEENEATGEQRGVRVQAGWGFSAAKAGQTHMDGTTTGLSPKVTHTGTHGSALKQDTVPDFPAHPPANILASMAFTENHFNSHLLTSHCPGREPPTFAFPI